jgi:hypothetical protein
MRSPERWNDPAPAAAWPGESSPGEIVKQIAEIDRAEQRFVTVMGGPR